MLTYMLNEQLAEEARTKLEVINSDHLTTPEHIEQLLLFFDHDGQLIIQYKCADGITRTVLSFSAMQRPAFFLFEDWVREQLHSQSQAVLTI